MENKERIYIGKNYRLIIEQTIGLKVFNTLKEQYIVKELRGDDESIHLIEEKNGKENNGNSL